MRNYILKASMHQISYKFGKNDGKSDIVNVKWLIVNCRTSKIWASARCPGFISSLTERSAMVRLDWTPDLRSFPITLRSIIEAGHIDDRKKDILTPLA
jgi:hypothetical protein